MLSNNYPDRESEKRGQDQFLALLLPVRNRLMHFALAMTHNHDEANDLVSDTILAALERFDGLKSQTAFLSYLFTIAVRLHKRRRWRQRIFGRYDEHYAESLPSDGISPEASADAVMLYQALAKLPERQREAVVLFEISDLSLEDIREIQGGSLSGVKSRLVRGREKLAQLLNVAESPGQGFRTKGTLSTGRQRGGNHYLILSESQSNG